MHHRADAAVSIAMEPYLSDSTCGLTYRVLRIEYYVLSTMY